MANMFALILAIATLVTGIFWCIDKVKWAPARRAKREAQAAETTTEGLSPAELKAQAKAKAKAEQPGWRETTASVFPVLFVVFFVRSFLYEPFQIPSASMMPTLLIGDFILVEKYAYGLKNPLTQNTLIETGHPKRGDIAVFKYPKDPSLDYIKRVIGLPGDRVTYDPYSKTLTVNPGCDNGNACDKALPVTYSDIKASDFVETFGGYSGKESGNGFYQIPPEESVQGGVRLATRDEKLGEVAHQILLLTQVANQPGYQQPGQPPSTWVVPQGMYFMMGDNRDNSADSRYWGFVPERNLVGKATAIWMSFEKQEGQWPTGVRLSRIGGIH